MITRPVLTLKINFPCRKREKEGEEERKDESAKKNLETCSPASFVGHRLKVATVFYILPEKRNLPRMS